MEGPQAEGGLSSAESRRRCIRDSGGRRLAQGGHTNAYFTGFGSSRRIVLYDTLLQDHKDPAEVESILAHEMGHWLHHHIVKGIILGSVGSFVGLLLLFLFLRWMQGRAPCYLQNAADPAGLPLIILLVALTSWVVMPVENVFSRYIERQADEESLKLAGQPEAFSPPRSGSPSRTSAGWTRIRWTSLFCTIRIHPRWNELRWPKIGNKRIQDNRGDAWRHDVGRASWPVRPSGRARKPVSRSTNSLSKYRR